MNRAQQLGQWAGRILLRQHRTKLIVLLVLGFIFTLFFMAEVRRGRVAPQAVTKSAAEIEAEKARVEAERQAQAERRRQAELERQAEAERQRQAEIRRETEQRQAEEKYKQSIRDDTNRVIKACVAAVRQRSDGRYFRSSFDAYATGEYAENGGTPEEHFQFQKCMAERGHPLTTTSKDKK